MNLNLPMCEKQKRKSARPKTLLFAVLLIPLMNSIEAGGIEIEKLQQSVVAIETSGGNFRTGMVIKIDDKKALILTAKHNIDIPEDTIIRIEFYNVRGWSKGKLDKFDESRDIALFSIEQPPSNIRCVHFGKLKEEDQIRAIGQTAEVKWDVLPVNITSIVGGKIIFSPPPGNGFSGAPLFDIKKGCLIGMVQTEILADRSPIRGEALKSEIIRKILDVWMPDTPLGNKLSFAYHYPFFGEMAPYMERPRWKFSRGTSLGLGVEFARNGKIGPHECGILYSSFKSDPIGDNATGTLRSTFVIPFWKYQPLFRIGRQDFGLGFACGLGVGTHSLENGEFFSGVIIDRPGVKDKHDRLAMLVDVSLKYYLRWYFSISLGWQLMGSTVEEFDIFYHDLYLTGEFRVSLL